MDSTADDPGCSEAGNHLSGYGLGDCPIRREPCPTGCLRKTIRSLQLSVDSHPLREEVTRKIAREEGMLEAARLAKGVGSGSVSRAILARSRKPSTHEGDRRFLEVLPSRVQAAITTLRETGPHLRTGSTREGLEMAALLLESLLETPFQERGPGPGEPKSCPHGEGFNCPTCWPRK